MTPKGKSPLDKMKREEIGAHTNSVEKQIMLGKWTLPGKTKEQTKAAYRAWQKQHKFNQQAMERWYRTSVKDYDRYADHS